MIVSNVKLGHGVSTPDALRKSLKELHDTKAMSWRKIAQELEKEGYNIPAGSLCTFVKTGELANKYKAQLGLNIVDVSQPLAERRKKTPAWVKVGADFLAERDRPKVFTRPH